MSEQIAAMLVDRSHATVDEVDDIGSPTPPQLVGLEADTVSHACYTPRWRGVVVWISCTGNYQSPRSGAVRALTTEARDVANNPPVTVTGATTRCQLRQGLARMGM